jgi:cob(I)alamin adenosyltransferase
MGMAFRAAGHGLKTLMIQFIKGSRRYGELDAAEKLSPLFQIMPMGKGFIRFDKGGPDAEDVEAVRNAWGLFLEKMASSEFQMIILDEVNYAVDFGLLPLEQLLRAIEEKPEGLHLVLTGRNARPEVLEKADLVTEMKEIKHPYKKGIKGQKGIEY